MRALASLWTALLFLNVGLLAQTVNPTPVIYQPLNPASAAPGGAGFSMTVEGSGFASASVVNWNGSSRPTTFVSSSQLTVAITASDIAVPGTAAITVDNPAPGGGVSNVIYFPVTGATPAVFLARSDLATGSAPFSVFAGDFTGSGTLSLATANYGANTVSVLIGNGDGTFAAAVDYPTGNLPTSIIAGDFNHDGALDLAVTNSGDGAVSVLLGNGNGTFRARTDYAANRGAFALGAADLNGDGNLDLIVANSGSASISVLLGNGDGTFSAPVDYSTGNNPQSVAIADFNGDGKLDIAVADNADNLISVLSGNGDGTFQPKVDYPANSPRSLVAADLNGDGAVDLVAAASGSDQVSVLLGNGNGTFSPAAAYATGGQVHSVALGDLNGDGKLDLAVTDFDTSQISVLLGNGDGTFQTHLDFSAPASPETLIFGDFNGDGRMEVAAAIYSGSAVSVFLQAPAVRLSAASLTFSTQDVGTTSAAQSTALTNSGSASLNLSAISLGGQNAGDFAETNTGIPGGGASGMLAAGASCTISVTFTPSSTGTRSAAIVITDNAVDSPQAVSVSGTGGAPLVSFAPASLSFLQQVVGTSSASQMIALSNPGNASLLIRGIATSGDFTQTNSCVPAGSSSGTLAAGASCSVWVTFVPTAAGTRNGSLVVSDNANGSPQSAGLTGIAINGINLIQHVVFIIKENRTFDTYFGTFPGANGATSGKISTGATMPIIHQTDRMPSDIDHDWNAARVAIDNGLMNQFDRLSGANNNGDYSAYTQMWQQDIPNYWAYAQNFVLADNSFSSLKGETFPNRLYTVAAQSGGVISDGTNSPGCDAVSSTTVQVLNATTGVITNVYPCFDFMTLADTLQAAGLSWKYYGPTCTQTTSKALLSPLDAISHIRNSSLWTTNVTGFTNFAGDAAAGRLSNFNWLTSTLDVSEHPPNSACAGENWTVQQINAIMQGPQWQSTAIFLSYDDFGGLYDHVAPPQADVYGFGPRVPMLIISPYSKQGYISHTLYEFSSVLKFAEEAFNLPALTSRDAAANDMLDAFDFTQAPRPPLVLNTRTCPASTYLSTRTLTFASQTVGTTSPTQNITVKNLGSAALSLSNITVSGDYHVTSTTCSSSLGVSASCSVSVSFTPAIAGPDNGVLSVSDNAVASPHTANLVGAGTVVSLSPASLTFSQALGTSSTPVPVTLTNNGTTALTISSIVDNSPSQFPYTTTCIPSGSKSGTVTAGASCIISIGFAPMKAGTVSSTLNVNDTGGGSPQIIHVTGTGIGPVASLSPASLTFASQAVGTTSAPQRVTLSNSGNATLNISGIASNGTDFAQSNSCIAAGSSSGTLAAGASCSLTVTFTPTATGTRRGTVTINDNAGSGVQTISLTGSGT